MKQFVSISIAFVAAASSGGLAQVSHSSLAEITREGRYWVQTINGAATATPLDRVRLDTVGNVVLQGDNGEKVTYKLKLRVRARDAREAEALLREFDVKYRTQNGWLRLTVTPPANISEGPELTVNVPRSLQQVWIETRGGNVQASDLDGELQARSAAGVIRVQSAGGESSLDTAGGEIFVHQAVGPLHAATAGGNIRVERASN